MKNKRQNLYVVRKYIIASSAADAIKKDKIAPVDDVWIDEGYKGNQGASAIGFVDYRQDND